MLANRAGEHYLSPFYAVRICSREAKRKTDLGNVISQSAIKILQKRFGKPQQIVSTHMDELLKIPNCTNDKTQSLRLVYDTSIPGPYQRWVFLQISVAAYSYQ